MNIGIIGLGLLGGSIALAAKKNGDMVIAYDTCSATIQTALSEQSIDIAVAQIADITAADLIIVAVPVLAMAGIFAELSPHLKENCVVSDVGSTKIDIIKQASDALGKKSRRFVAAHPVAGSEKSGLAAAHADLFTNRTTVFCDIPASDNDAIQTVEAFWRGIGAKTVRMSADEHDRIFSLVSHLPHVLAYALVGVIGADAEHETLMRHTAGGFRDFTRIAGSEPMMWRDICLTNKQPLLEAIATYQAQLAQLADEVKTADGQALFERFELARQMRQELLSMQEKRATSP